jgi:hypothetical protein
VSSTCVYSNSPELIDIKKNASKILRRNAEELKIGYSISAISVDHNTEVGVKFLERFGYFDEISSGLGRKNIALLYNIHLNGLMDTTIPKIIILTRTYKTVKFNDGKIHRLGILNE